MEYSETNTEDPSAYLNVIDATDKGFTSTINTIITEGVSEATLKYLRQIRIPLGNVGNAALYANTSYNLVGEKLRLLATVAGNGIHMIEWE